MFGLDAGAERRRLPHVASPAGSASGTLTSSPESFPGYHHFPYNVTQATWQSPLTNKLLLEAGFSRFQYLWAGFGQVPPDGITDLIPVQEQSAIYGQPRFFYRGLYDPLGFAYADNDANPNNWRMTASYVTGAHNMKVGYQGSFQKSAQGRVSNQSQLEYRFNNGVPNAVSYYLAPRWEQNDRTETHSLFAQDQWTRGRLTLQGGLRYDRAFSWAPADGNGTSLTSKFNPQPISFPETVSVKGYNDITPRVGAAYDVFGNGKTAVKVNVGKYLQAATNDENYWANNPALRTVTSVLNRGWTDGNRNFVVDCNLLNPAAQNNLAAGGDNCAAATGTGPNFGNTNPNLTTVNPAILQGWGIRPYDWQFGATRAAAAGAARLARGELQPALVRQLLRDGQPAHEGVGLQPVEPDGAAESEPARRRKHGDVFRRQSRRRNRRAQLPDVRDRLRAGAHAVLARRDHQPERAAAQRRSRSRPARAPAAACRTPARS